MNRLTVHVYIKNSCRCEQYAGNEATPKSCGFIDGALCSHLK